MTTTVSVSSNGQMKLPEEFRKRKKIRPGTALRVTEAGEGLYVTLLPEPTQKELRAVIAAAGSLTHRETCEDGQMVQEAITEYRAEKRRKQG